MNDPNEASRDLKTPLLDNVIEPEPDVAVVATEPPHQDLEEGTESNPPPTAPHAPNHEDELLQAPTLEVIHAEAVDSTITASEGEYIRITRDRWKDGFCSCCKHGCFHDSLIIACCFPTGNYENDDYYNSDCDSVQNSNKPFFLSFHYSCNCTSDETFQPPHYGRTRQQQTIKKYLLCSFRYSNH
jgi:hypothetical protein